MKVPKISFVLSLLWIGVAMVSAQVETRFYPEGDAPFRESAAEAECGGGKKDGSFRRFCFIAGRQHYPGGP